MNELREKIRNDPNNFYTYSEKYLSLSIDPYTLEQQKQKEKILSLSVKMNVFNIFSYKKRKCKAKNLLELSPKKISKSL